MTKMLQTQQKSEVRIHRNKPQLLFYAIMVRLCVLIWGRATGKTTGAISDFLLHCVGEMPRSNGAIYCNSYVDILTKVLPALVNGWEQWGVHEKMHYFIGEYAPEHWRWPKAFMSPLDPRHYIQWCNGSGIFLVSGDNSTSNGFSLDYAVVDEARKQRKDRLDEFLLTVRGNARHFGKKSCHHAKLLVSDMPRTSSEMWLLEYEKEMDKEAIELILCIQMQIIKLEEELNSIPVSDSETREKVNEEIEKFLQHLNTLRSDAVYFSEASTLENVHALGLGPILEFQKVLGQTEFAISVLNKRIIAVKNSFYPLLNWDEQSIDADDIFYISSLGIEKDIKNAHKVKRDCLWDADVNPSVELDICFDHNNKINCVVTGQLHGDEYRVLNSQFVLKPNFLKEMVYEWCRYYRNHKHKVVNYVYDHTSIKGDASGNISFAEEVSDILVQHGWSVNRCNIGRSPLHHSRYYLWHTILKGNDKRLPRLVFNRNNCEQLKVSMANAPVKKIGKEYRKVKTSETDDKVKPQDATHLSEAADILIWYRYNPKFNKDSGFAGTAMG